MTKSTTGEREATSPTKTTASGEPAQPAPETARDIDSNLDKIREILIGTQARETDRRVSQIELHLSKELATIRDETKRSLESLENYIRKEIESLTSFARQEQNQRIESVRRTDDELSKQTRELREKTFDLSKFLSEEIARRADELTKFIESAIKELDGRKMERNALGGLLQEMGMRLTEQFTLSEGRAELKRVS